MLRFTLETSRCDDYWDTNAGLDAFCQYVSRGSGLPVHALPRERYRLILRKIVRVRSPSGSKAIAEEVQEAAAYEASAIQSSNATRDRHAHVLTDRRVRDLRWSEARLDDKPSRGTDTVRLRGAKTGSYAQFLEHQRRARAGAGHRDLSVA